MDVKDNSEGVVRFDLKAPKVPQKVVIKVTAMMGSVSVDRVVEIPVRPPIPWASLAGTGEVREGQTAVFKLPSGWVSTTGNAQLSIQALPSLKMLGGLKFLLQYPYGCIEQTTSTVFPLLYLNELAAQIDPKKFNAAGVRNAVTAGIERIISMQTLSGGFGWWPGSSDEYVWGSIYATDFLLEADRAGYPVPQMSQTGGLNYLEKILSGKDSEYSLQEKSYAVYVLAKGGRIKASWIRRLQERMKDLPEYSRFHIAGALAIMGDRKTAEEILAKGMSDNPIDMETDGSLNSYTRQQALALTMYMDISPNSPFVPGLVKRLENSMKDGRWATTQENGTALIALGKYARYLSLNEANLKGLVFVDGQKKYFFDSQNGFKVSDRVLVGKEITIEVTGTGSMYYTWLVDGVPAIDKVEEKDSGLSVRRVFLTKEGNPVDLNKVRQGDVLIADITVDPQGMANNLVIEDLLPAGFEVENPRLRTSEKLDGEDEESETEEHMDIRDDRLVFFTNVNGITHYKYVVRAVTRGDFILPAVRAELMYSPNIYSINGQGRVKIVE